MNANRGKPQLKIDDVWIDVSLSETHKYGAEVTEHPVEKDSPIADHVRALPQEIEIEGIVTDYPINQPESHSSKRTTGVFEALVEIVNKSKLVKLVTGLQMYDNIVLTNLSFHRSPETGPAAYKFTCTAHRIRFVESKSEPVPKEKRQQPRKQRGLQEMQTPQDPREAQRLMEMRDRVPGYNSVLRGGAGASGDW